MRSHETTADPSAGGAARSRSGWFLLVTGSALTVASISGLADAMRAGDGVGAMLTHWPWMLSVLLVLLGSALVLTRVADDRLHRPSLLAVGAPILALHAVPVLAWPTARTFTAWVHAGLADHLVLGGEPLAEYDVRLAWPAAFGWIGQLAEAAGVSPLELARLWPVVVQVVLAAAVMSLAGAFGAGWRSRLLAGWVWTLTSFVGQDYMSPQSLNLVLYVATLAQIVRLAKDPGDRKAFTLAAVFSLASVVSHPLTPVVLGAVTFAVILVVREARHLWRLLAIQIAAETVYLAVWGREAILRNERFRDELGDISTWLGTNLTNRLGRAGGDTGRLLVLVDRLTLTGLVLLGAVLVLVRIRRADPGTARVPFAFLVAPLAITLLIPYGGEIFLRGALFTGVIASVLIGWWLATSRRSGRWTIMVGVVLGLLFVPARWGNDTFERFDPETVAAVEWALANSGTGDRIVTLDLSGPVRHRHFTTRVWRMLSLEQIQDTEQLATILSLGTGRGYVILSEDSARSRAYMRGAPDDLFETVAASLERHPGFVRVRGDADSSTQVFQPVDNVPASPEPTKGVNP